MSSYIRCFTCNICGDATFHGRLSGGAVAAAAAELGITPADAVIDAIGTAVLADSVRVTPGVCWCCISEGHVSRDTLVDDLEIQNQVEIPGND